MDKRVKYWHKYRPEIKGEDTLENFLSWSQKAPATGLFKHEVLETPVEDPPEVKELAKKKRASKKKEAPEDE